MTSGNKKVSLAIKKIAINTDEDCLGRTIADLVKWSVNELKKTSDGEKKFQDFLREHGTKSFYK
jgi:hypothetical protein